MSEPKWHIPGGIRTHDLWIRSPARYPLRYGDLHLQLLNENLNYKFLLQKEIVNKKKKFILPCSIQNFLEYI